MSTVTAKALLQLEQSRCLKRQQVNEFGYHLHSLTIGDPHGSFSEILKSDPHEYIQRSDRYLHLYVKNKDYRNALRQAEYMRDYIPESYYGYQRTAQIRLIRNEYDRAYDEYSLGFTRVSEKDGIELLRKSVEDTRHIFEQAAIELVKALQFLEGTAIAFRMISLLPTSPTGYLLGAKLYEMQGKTKNAMAVYGRGIKYTSADNHDLLVKQMNSLQQRIDQMPYLYDFITQLPLEILLHITQYFDTHDLVECMYVTTRWKERIQQCPEAWRVVSMRCPRKHIRFAAFKQIKPFVQNITLEEGSYSNPSLVQDILASIGDGEFENLTFLKLDSDTMEPRYKERITRLLERVDLTGLDLEFNFDKRESYIPLHQILKSCPHLKLLSYHTDSFPLTINYDLLPPEPTMITHLSIGGFPYYDEELENPRFFDPLIPLFPRLVYLCITANDRGTLQMIMSHCPSLRILLVMHVDIHEIRQDFPYNKNAPRGLQHLEIDGFPHPEDVADIVAQNRNTLEFIDLTLQYENDVNGQRVDPDWNWWRLSKIDFPVLRELYIYIDYYWPLRKWIGDCPVLEELVIEYAYDGGRIWGYYDWWDSRSDDDESYY